MSDALLPYYNRELGAIRQLAAAFAAAYRRSPAGCVFPAT